MKLAEIILGLIILCRYGVEFVEQVGQPIIEHDEFQSQHNVLKMQVVGKILTTVFEFGF